MWPSEWLPRALRVGSRWEEVCSGGGGGGPHYVEKHKPDLSSGISLFLLLKSPPVGVAWHLPLAASWVGLEEAWQSQARPPLPGSLLRTPGPPEGEQTPRLWLCRQGEEPALPCTGRGCGEGSGRPTWCHREQQRPLRPGEGDVQGPAPETSRGAGQLDGFWCTQGAC